MHNPEISMKELDAWKDAHFVSTFRIDSRRKSFSRFSLVKKSATWHGCKKTSEVKNGSFFARNVKSLASLGLKLDRFWCHAH